MSDLGLIALGILIGFFGLFAFVAWTIKQQDKTPLRKTVGEFLKELGEIIARSDTNKIPHD